MKIEYKYKIINVDKETKCMEIVYESSKYGVLHVGARLPWKNETIEQIVEMYNPVRYWLEKEMETLNVAENLEGVQSVDVLEISDAPIDLAETPPPPQLSMSKYQTFFSLASFGLLHKADIAVSKKGSLRLKMGWADTSNLLTIGWTIRACKETVELQKLLDITEEQMDNIFIKGVEIDPVVPKKNMSNLEKELLDKEIRIWELKENLAATDYKVTLDYDKIDDELKNQRQEWRDEIRKLAQEIEEISVNKGSS